MDQVTTVAVFSISLAGITIAIGGIMPGYSEGRALVEALRAIARQPDESNTITRTLFVGMALIESVAIYSLVISLMLLFFNPFWNTVSQALAAGGGG